MSEDILARVPPQNLDAEQSVLGAILLRNEALFNVMDVLTAEHFYRETHREIYRAMLALSAANQPIDAITMGELLRTRGALEAIGGVGYIAELADCVPSSEMIGHYVQIVIDKATLRAIAATARDIAGAAYDNPRDVAAFASDSAAAFFRTVDPTIPSHTVYAPELVRIGQRNIELASERGEAVTGIATGLRDLDLQTCGLQDSELIIIAARPAVGKTALALNIAAHAAGLGRRVLFCSLEMSIEQLSVRLLCSEARINPRRVNGGRLSQADIVALATTGTRVAQLPLVIDDTSSLSPIAVKAIARRELRQGGIDLVIVDYLQLMNPPRPYQSREREVSECSRAMKALAKELHVPVVVLSQLNRQVAGREDHVPRLVDLRESGAIEQDADVIIFIHDEEMWKKPDDRDPAAPRKLIIAKQRNGPANVTVDVAYIAEQTRFESYAPPSWDDQ